MRPNATPSTVSGLSGSFNGFGKLAGMSKVYGCTTFTGSAVGASSFLQEEANSNTNNSIGAKRLMMALLATGLIDRFNRKYFGRVVICHRSHYGSGGATNSWRNHNIYAISNLSYVSI